MKGTKGRRRRGGDEGEETTMKRCRRVILRGPNFCLPYILNALAIDRRQRNAFRSETWLHATASWRLHMRGRKNCYKKLVNCIGGVMHLVKRHTQEGLLLFLGATIGLTFVEGLFEHMVKKLSYGDGSSQIF